MADKKKIIAAAATAGVAAATTGILVAKKRKDGSGPDTPPVYHVKPAGDGWAVEAEGSKRASSRHPNKKSAVEAGRTLARSRAPSRLVIHGVDGTIQRHHEYEVGD